MLTPQCTMGSTGRGGIINLQIKKRVRLSCNHTLAERTAKSYGQLQNTEKDW